MQILPVVAQCVPNITVHKKWGSPAFSKSKQEPSNYIAEITKVCDRIMLIYNINSKCT